MNLVLPVSSGKYCGTCVSTAPAVEPDVLSFTVSLTGSTIDVIAAVVSTCSASTDCTDSLVSTCSGSVCIAMPCGGGSFTPDGAYDSLWDSVKPLTGEYTINFFQYQEDVGGVHAECLDQLHRRYLCRQLQLLPGSSWRTSVAVRSGGCICTVTGPSFLGVQTCRKLRIFRSCSSWRDGKAFFGPCTQVHGHG